MTEAAFELLETDIASKVNEADVVGKIHNILNDQDRSLQQITKWFGAESTGTVHYANLQSQYKTYRLRKDQSMVEDKALERKLQGFSKRRGFWVCLTCGVSLTVANGDVKLNRLIDEHLDGATHKKAVVNVKLS